MAPDPVRSVFTHGVPAPQRLTTNDANRINVNNSTCEIQKEDSRLFYLLPGNVLWIESVAATGISAAQVSICWSEIP